MGVGERVVLVLVSGASTTLVTTTREVGVGVKGSSLSVRVTSPVDVITVQLGCCSRSVVGSDDGFSVSVTTMRDMVVVNGETTMVTGLGMPIVCVKGLAGATAAGTPLVGVARTASARKILLKQAIFFNMPILRSGW